MNKMLRPAVALMCLIGAGSASAACTATYATRNDWATGFVGAAGASAIGSLRRKLQIL